MRKAKIERKTKETEIELEINLDGTGKNRIETRIGFLNHMLELFSKHSLIDFALKAKGDLEVDEHHLTEDIGICLGMALKKALGEKKGIQRYGSAIIPMDESLALCAVDFSDRGYPVINAEFERKIIGGFPTELIQDFFEAVALNAGMNLHIKVFYGRNTHHKIEAIFKAFARAVKNAVELDKRIQGVPSTKGVL